MSMHAHEVHEKTAHAQATLYDEEGRERTDEDIGSLACPDTMKGEALAIASMKAVTKAKRRVTLSICGLGMLDETELGDSQADRTPQAPAPNVLVSPPPPLIPPAVGTPPAPVAGDSPAPPQTTPLGDGAGALAAMAREAAGRGEDTFQVFWSFRSVEERAALAPLAKELRKLMDEAKG